MVSSRSFCTTDNGQVVIYKEARIETAPSMFLTYFEVVMQPNGTLKVKLLDIESNSKRIPSSLLASYCYLNSREPNYYAVESIDGFTDLHSYIFHLIEQGYSH